MGLIKQGLGEEPVCMFRFLTGNSNWSGRKRLKSYSRQPEMVLSGDEVCFFTNGRVELSIEKGLDQAKADLEELKSQGIDINEICRILQEI